MADAVFTLRWKDHISELGTAYERLLENSFLVDCTISAEGQSLKAHRLILSASSSYFHMLFEQETEKHPFVILLDTSFEALKAVIDFVYQGQTQIRHENLKEFLTLARSLQIKGLNALSNAYVENLSINATESISQGQFEDIQVQDSSSNHEDNPINSSQQFPHQSFEHQDAVRKRTSVPFEGYSASCEEVQSPQEYQRPLQSDAVHVDTDVTIIQEPLNTVFSDARNEILGNVPMSENVGNEIQGTASVLDEQEFNQYSGCSEFSCGNVSSAMPPSQQQLTQFSEPHFEEVILPDEPFLPAILFPKREHISEEDCEEPMVDLGVPGKDANETDEGTETARGEENPEQCLREEDPLRENDLWVGSPQSKAPPSQSELLLRQGRRAPRCQDSGEGSVLRDVGRMAAASSSNVTSHKDTHTDERPFRCDVCGASFTSSRHLTIHNRIHTGEHPFVCQECGKGFRQKSTLIIHVRTHTGERPLVCDVCGNAFSDPSSLSRHKRTHADETLSQEYVCQICGKACRSRGKLIQHTRTHGVRPFRCGYCEASFSYSRSLIVHYRIHTGERPYTCQECGKAFRLKSYLVIHKRTHTGERPLVCDVCGDSFSDPSNLTRHKRKHTDHR